MGHTGRTVAPARHRAERPRCRSAKPASARRQCWPAAAVRRFGTKRAWAGRLAQRPSCAIGSARAADAPAAWPLAETPSPVARPSGGMDGPWLHLSRTGRAGPAANTGFLARLSQLRDRFRLMHKVKCESGLNASRNNHLRFALGVPGRYSHRFFSRRRRGATAYS